MTKLTNGHLVTQDSVGVTRHDYLYRISLKALIYNDAGQILVVKEINRTYWDLPGGGMDYDEDFESSLKRELYEEVGYKGDLYIERLDANQICFYCRVWPENFDFIPGEEGDEIMFINPEELLLQKSEVDAPARAYGAHMKWQDCIAKSCGKY